ncbi:hypothetical protein bcere0020_55060 [Bacillus cereus Rock3-29]|nr:hypothetical protein bcere0019_56410 [Bacillus cereus Rock3-28]EEL37104.1 hypothetical protein bcere0020_55060 [Bacillus cereus Rock3-29]PKR94430.1 hypothetical protein bcere0024_029550 [Bacillus cereus Rock4-18]
MDFVTFTKVFWKKSELKGNSSYEGLRISTEGAEATHFK